MKQILYFVLLNFKVYLFTYTDSAIMISMDEWTSTLAGQLVNGYRRCQLVLAKKL